MARPTPVVLASTIAENGKFLDILEVPVGYLVTFRGRPFSLRREVGATSGYDRVFFALPAHAHRLAKRLNTLFETDQFAVRAVR